MSALAILHITRLEPILLEQTNFYLLNKLFILTGDLYNLFIFLLSKLDRKIISLNTLSLH